MSAFRFDGSINSAGLGTACEGVLVYVLTQPANTTVFPPTPLASLFTDSTGVTPLANPVTTDGNGNFFFYAATGTYTLYYYDPFQRIPTEIFPDQAVVTQGGGSVTSVALTMPAEFAVAGSPITSSGTLAVTKNNQNANLVYAGPGSGPAAAPTFRALVSSDLPAGGGSVTSVALTVAVPAYMTEVVTGSPITGSGTFAITLGFANQNAGTFLAGPASGSPAAPTFRALTPADISGVTNVAFSATPTFDASTFMQPTFTITLTGNVTSSTIINPSNGERIVFVITQDGTGSRTFAWPANTKGSSIISGDANSVSVQEFVYDGTNWRATSAGDVALS
jgi:hypothetical protein